jgi:hypothetical protein
VPVTNDAPDTLYVDGNLRRAVHISEEPLISVQTDMQTDINMDTNMAVDIGDKSVYIPAFWRQEDQSINKS